MISRRVARSSSRYSSDDSPTETTSPAERLGYRRRQSALCAAELLAAERSRRDPDGGSRGKTASRRVSSSEPEGESECQNDAADCRRWSPERHPERMYTVAAALAEERRRRFSQIEKNVESRR